MEEIPENRIKQLMGLVLDKVELFPKRQANGRWVRNVRFKVPLDVDGTFYDSIGFHGDGEEKGEGDDSVYFLPNEMHDDSIRLMLKKYTKLAGIERNITPHMFRHSFATYLIEEGVDISCVQRILGHSSIKTTQIYIHIASKKQAEILREMHPRNRMKIRAA